MEKDDELWLKKMREMLIEYDEPAPLHGWEKLQREFHSPVERRIIPKHFWVAAAAVLLLTVSGISFYFLHSPVADDIRLTSAPDITVIPDIVPVVPVAENKTSRTEPVDEVGKSSTSFIAHVIKPIEEEAVTNVEQAPETNESIYEEDEQNIVPDQLTEEVVNDQPVAEKSENKQAIRRPSGKDKLHLPVEAHPNSSNSSKNWSVALSVNSGSGNSLNNSGSTDSHPRSLAMYDFASIANSPSMDFLDISNNELQFQNGLPILNGYTFKHKQPVTFGLSVRKGITSSISLETGLTYTYLSSDIHSQGEKGKKEGEQKLHYVGIPLKINWDFVNTDRFNVYLTGGGAVEKCVHGKTLNNSNKVKSLQFSLAGGVGVQYNITQKIGLYAEPGVAYFFDDGSETETIRKENKFNINLQAGIRLTY